MCDDDLPEFYVPDEELRPLLEAIGNAVVERLGGHGLTGVVVRYDEEEGHTHVTAYFRKYPDDMEEEDAIWTRLIEVDRMFSSDTVMLIVNADEYDGSAEDSYSDHVLTMKAA